MRRECGLAVDGTECTYGQIYMCTNGIPVEIQTPTRFNVMTVLPPELSPNNTLLPPSFRCSLISERKILARFLSVSPSSTNLRMLVCACNLDGLQTSLWLRKMFPSLLTREPGFDPGSIRVWFVVGRVAGDQVLLLVMRLSPVSIASPLFCSNIHLCALPIRRANFRNFRVT